VLCEKNDTGFLIADCSGRGETTCAFCHGMMQMSQCLECHGSGLVADQDGSDTMYDLQTIVISQMSLMCWIDKFLISVMFECVR
jgi:hypothetical protein